MKKTIFSSMLIAIVLVFGVSSLPAKVHSLGVTVHPSSGLSHTGDPFGGPIVYKLQCSAACGTPWEMIYLYDYATYSLLKLTIEPGKSKLYKYQENFEAGRYALGTYSKPAFCYIGSPPNCIDMKPDGYINSGPGAGASGPLSQ